MKGVRTISIGLIGLVLAGCHTDMWVQPKLKPYQQDDHFSDTRSARDPIAGTIARGHYHEDKSFTTGFDEHAVPVSKLPPTLNQDGETLSTTQDLGKILRWGQDRFLAFCSHCHGETGDGNGMITQRGLVLRRSPANFHTDRLRKMPIGHFYEVQTNGYGIMMSSASRVTPDERWAIAAYIRALQLSRNANKSQLSKEDLDKLGGEGKP